MNRLFKLVGALALLVSMLAGLANTASAATPREKCDWMIANFPQTTAEVQALGAAIANVETERITTVPLRCDTKTKESVFQGFIVLGMLEGYPEIVTISPWEHGAVDGSSENCGYTYDGEITVEAEFPQECDNTVRLHNGTATGTRFTWYGWDDANPPSMDDTYDWQAVIDGTSASTDTEAKPASADSGSSTDDTCMLGAAMAKKMGWTVQDTQPESVTMYGGAVVDVTKDSTLPEGWAAKDGDLDYVGGDLLTPNTYSIYPPQGECRDTLGVDQ